MGSVAEVGRRQGEKPGDVLREEREAGAEDRNALSTFVHHDVLGYSATFHSAFGPRRTLYADWTATAKEEVRNLVRAGDEDVVLFCGSGATSAVAVLRSALHLPTAPILVHGPFAHHSSLLPWREMAYKVYSVPETRTGELDLGRLESILEEAEEEARLGSRLILGCFAAVSNVTGVCVDSAAASRLLHRHGALSVWDYASGVNSEELGLNSPGDPAASKDAIFFSAHKLVGAVAAPGILVAKKRLFRNPVPLKGGGGTVFFVQQDSHSYLRELEYREEGGTPDIIGAIRLGVAIRLRISLGTEFIKSKELALCRRLGAGLSGIKGVELLGPSLGSVHKLPLFSFLVRPILGSSRLFLHHNFVAALLDNLFGIQSRSGCLCAGPYAQELLGIDAGLATDFHDVLAEPPLLDRHHLRRKAEYSQLEMLRPGMVRLSVAYFATHDEVDYIIAAVKFVAEHGWAFLPQYRLNPESGEWHHVDKIVFKDRKWLGRLTFGRDGLSSGNPGGSKEPAPSWAECLAEAERLAGECVARARRQPVPDVRPLFTHRASTLRWFLLPIEAKEALTGTLLHSSLPHPPFHPKAYLSHPSLPPPPSLPAHSPLPPTLELPSVQPSKGLTPRRNGDTAQDESSECTSEVCGVRTESLRQDWSAKTVNYAKPAFQLTQKWHSPPNTLFKHLQKAIDEFQMIKDGDRVLVCLSGGKDSLSLLHCLHQYQYVAKSQGVLFELGAVTVDPGSEGYDPSPLIPYLAGLNLTYLYERQNILAQALEVDCRSICAFCSRMKRGRLYAAARREGFNVLAFGQHLDDLAESFLMSAFHNALLRTMLAHYTVKAGDLRIVRPLVYVREKELRAFAESQKLPVIPENCPACFEQPKERHRMKQLLASEELLHPALFPNLASALSPLIAAKLTIDEEPD